MTQPRLAVAPEQGTVVARASGDWIIEHAAVLARRMERLRRQVPAGGRLELRCAGVTRPGSAGRPTLSIAVEDFQAEFDRLHDGERQRARVTLAVGLTGAEGDRQAALRVTRCRALAAAPEIASAQSDPGRPCD